MPYPLQLAPIYQDYTWGGYRLRPGNERTAEAWVVYEQNRILNGSLAGKTLLEAVQELGPELLGKKVYERTGDRFPLLIKLLDCADWLSLQVHPNDEQARRMVGPDKFGKTEAWHILEAEPDSTLLFGLRPGTTKEAITEALNSSTVLDLVQSHKVQQGDTIFIRPGMIHALGPGLLIFEVQQTSNITYRVYDWGRPQTEKRKLHIAESLEVLDPQAEAHIVSLSEVPDSGAHTLATSQYFTLEVLRGEGTPLQFDPGGESFHTLTIVEGQAKIEGSTWSHSLARHESLLLPANIGPYRVIPDGPLYALKSFVPA
jgi:mannose-6-phosphate isomerase